MKVLNIKATENVSKVRIQTSNWPFSPNFKAAIFSKLRKMSYFVKLSSECRL